MHKKKKSSERKGYTSLFVMLAVIITLGSMWTYKLVFLEDKGSQTEAASTADTSDFSQYTGDNSLNVVEIVPNIMMAEMGFQIKGGEILDYSAMEKASNAKYAIASGMATYEDLNVLDKWFTVIYSLEYFKRYSLGMEYVDSELLKKQAVQQRLDEEIASSKDSTYINACNKLKNSAKYKIEQADQKKLDKFNSINVKYEAVLISELKTTKNLEKYLKEADLIVISGGTTSSEFYSTYPYLKEKYAAKYKKWPTDIVNTSFSYDPEERLTWEAAKYIFDLSAVEGGVPVIMPYFAVNTIQQDTKEVLISKTYVNDSGVRKQLDEYVNQSKILSSSNNMLKLFLMLFRKDAITFKNDYYRYVTKSTGEYELQNGDAKTYWSQQTFYDYETVDYNNGKVNYKEVEIGNNLQCYSMGLVNNGFVYNNNKEFQRADCAINENLNISTNGYFDSETGIYYNSSEKFSKDVVEYFGEDKTKISCAQAINFLLAKRAASESSNNTVTKSSLRVLEIEPSNEFTISKEQVASDLNSYTGDITIDTMTSQEFNGTRTDLAGTYDLIYLGGNRGGLSEKTNEEAYGTIAYMHTGDLAKLTSGKEDHYSGNDLTKEKKEELEKYVQSKLPIVIADDIYEKKTVDTASNLYSLLQSILGEKNVMKASLVTSKQQLTTIVSYTNQPRPEIKMIRAEYDSSSLSIQFQIKGLDNLATKTQTAKLYADLDGDGIVEEKILASKEIAENGTETLRYNGIQQAANAVIYHLVVTFDDETHHYTSVEGTVTRSNTNKEKVRVLQLMPDNSTIELAKETGVVGKKVSEVTEYQIEVTTLGVKEYVALYDSSNGGEAYDPDKILTDQLINYDVVVLGFSVDYPQINNQHGALDNLIAFIEKKKSVVITNSVLQNWESYYNDKTKQAYEKLRELSGMKRYAAGSDTSYALNNKEHTVSATGSTYATLNKNTKDMKYSMFNVSGVSKLEWENKTAFATDTISEVNRGMVTTYPYTIAKQEITQKTTDKTPGKTLSVLSAAKATAGEWQLDMTKAVGYYALANQDEKGRLLYSTSPNDIQNNYYLYHCGTVWYSGIGAKKLTASNEEEAKLFANTLIAAYTTAAKSPTVEFVDVTTTSSGDSIAFVDADVFSSKVGRDKRVSFVAKDPNTTKTGLRTTIYIKNGDTLEKITKAYAKGSDVPINLNSEKLTSEQQYGMVVDKNSINTSSNLWIYVIVENDTGVGMAKCELRRRNDFSLD